MFQQNQQQQQIPCPDCKKPIYFDSEGLIRGERFQCTGCPAVISIAAESREEAKEAMDNFSTHKQNMMKEKESFKS